MKGVLNSFVSENEVIKILFRAGFFISILFLMQYIVSLPVIIAQNMIIVNIDERNFIYLLISLLFVFPKGSNEVKKDCFHILNQSY